MWYNKNANLCCTAWADNTIVKTLSNFHQTYIEQEGLRQRKVDKEVKQEQYHSIVPAPEQMIDYLTTFHQVDKGNLIKSKYVLGRNGTKLHGWAPKLSF